MNNALKYYKTRQAYDHLLDITLEDPAMEITLEPIMDKLFAISELLEDSLDKETVDKYYEWQAADKS